jgi:hypothetical protein
VAAIALSLAGGLALYTRDAPGSGEPTAPAFAANQTTGDCTATAPTAERLGTVLNLLPLMSGADTDIAQWITPSVTIDVPMQLPAGTAVETAQRDRLAQLWNEFVACSAGTEGKQFGLLTDDGLRRAFYQATFASSGAVWLDPNLSGKNANVELQPTVVPPDESKPTPTAAPALQTSKISDLSGLTMGDAVTLPDGRIVASLLDPARRDPVEFAGIVVFAQGEGGWLIDDYYTFHG